MNWTVVVGKKVQKSLRKMPEVVVEAFEDLISDLKINGPARWDWPNYSKLTKGRYHCHLNYNYVVVWIEENKKLKIIEVIYVGSRENAPY
jgi:mRNA-degrading endonuclease RelE of RelBE toxin-antitoxin system